MEAVLDNTSSNYNFYVNWRIPASDPRVSMFM